MDQAVVSQLLFIFAIVVIIVNIMTQVTKEFVTFGSTTLLNLFVTVLSIILSVLVFTAYWQINGLTFAWYLIPAFIVVGFLCAYAAMFGYDKLIKNFSDILSD